MKKHSLTIRDHSRDAAGLTYVYPVISRRSGGLSIGINLNINNACNWRCIYCQVPRLKRGVAPQVDLQRLHDELLGILAEINNNTFFARIAVPPENRRIRDIAVSGNGEPTSAAAFAHVVEVIAQARTEAELDRNIKTVLISNGSLMQRSVVRAGLQKLNRINGEVWFKIDCGKREDLRQLNSTGTSMERISNNLRLSTESCRTWIQTCVFALNGKPAMDYTAYLGFLHRIVRERIPVAGVLLYSLARPSMQAEATHLSALPADWLENMAGEIRGLGLPVRVSV